MFLLTFSFIPLLVAYDEDIEGFQFTRLPSKKLRSSVDAAPENLNPIPEVPPQQSPRRGRPPKKKKKTETVPEETAGHTEKSAEMTSKRQTRRRRSPVTEPEPQPQSVTRSSARKREEAESVPKEKKRRKGRPSKTEVEARNGFVSPEPQQSSTAKIALPLADTPVIQRNKEMRKEAKSEKGGKGRRSSLGMRGRRASSLIDSGASNGTNGLVEFAMETAVLTTFQRCLTKRSTQPISTNILQMGSQNRGG